MLRQFLLFFFFKKITHYATASLYYNHDFMLLPIKNISTCLNPNCTVVRGQYIRQLVAFLCLYILYFQISIAQVGSWLALEDDSFIQVSDDDSFDFNQYVTIEAWISLCDVEGKHMILSKGNCDMANFSYAFQIINQRLDFRWSNDGYCYVGSVLHGGFFRSDEVITQPNVWYHVSVVYDGTSAVFYVNGWPVSGNSSGNYTNFYNSNAPLLVGTIADSGADPYLGYLNCFVDEVRIWNYGRNIAEIQGEMNSSLTTATPGLVLSFDMDNSAGGMGSGMVVYNKANITLNGTTVGGDFNSPFYAPAGAALHNLELGNDTTVCAGQPLLLNAQQSGLHYNWSRDGALLPETSATLFVSESGLYSVTAFIGNCSQTDQIQVNFQGGVGYIDTHICGGDVYIAPNGSTFDQSGNYQISLPTHSGLCDSTVLLQLYVDELYQEDVNEVVCIGSPYVLSNGQVITTPGIYQDTIKQQIGFCDSVVRHINLQFSPFIYADRDETICLGYGKILGGQLRYQQGIYNDTIYYDNACDTIYRVHLFVDDCQSVGCRLIVPTAFSPNGDAVNDWFRFVPTCDIRNLSVMVFDRSGHRVFNSINDPQAAWDGNYNGHPCETGAYVFNILYEIYDNNVWKSKYEQGALILVR